MPASSVPGRAVVPVAVQRRLKSAWPGLAALCQIRRNAIIVKWTSRREVTPGTKPFVFIDFVCLPKQPQVVWLALFAGTGGCCRMLPTRNMFTAKER